MTPSPCSITLLPSRYCSTSCTSRPAFCQMACQNMTTYWGKFWVVYQHLAYREWPSMDGALTASETGRAGCAQCCPSGSFSLFGLSGCYRRVVFSYFPYQPFFSTCLLCGCSHGPMVTRKQPHPTSGSSCFPEEELGWNFSCSLSFCSAGVSRQWGLPC